MSVEDALAGLGRVTGRSAYAYATSWPLEELELVRPDGSELRVLVKQLESRECIKPAFVYDPAREVEAYGLLGPEGLGTPSCYASGRWWLALEKVQGVELWQHGDLAAWQLAARWAACLHARFSRRSLDPTHLIRHDEAFYRGWVARAREMTGAALDPLLPASDAAIARLTALPATLIHGELYASNVLIAGSRVAVLDWEMAAVGPGVIDLGALVTGWGEAGQDAMIASYGEVDQADLAAAQFHLALQWLGWAVGWTAPAEHRRDWLAEARAAAERLT